MKKGIKIVCLILCVIVVIPCLFVACGENEEDTRRKITNALNGTWVFEERTSANMTHTSTATFYGDGTVAYISESVYVHESGYTDYSVLEYTGTYEVYRIKSGCRPGRWWVDITCTGEMGDLKKTLELIYDEDTGRLTVEGSGGRWVKK